MQELLLLLEVQQDSVLDQLQLLQQQQLQLVPASLLVELLLLLQLGDLGLEELLLQLQLLLLVALEVLEQLLQQLQQLLLL